MSCKILINPQHSSVQNKKPDFLQIYTDGSFNSKTQSVGAGFVIYHNNKLLLEGSFCTDTFYPEHCNVTGELFAVVYSLKSCLNLDIPSITRIQIFTDFTGCIDILRSEPKQKRKGLDAWYINQINFLVNTLQIPISMHHVKTHSGSRLNNRADYLARSACH